MRKKNGVKVVFLALLASISAYATTDEDLDCLKLTPVEKFELEVGSLSVGIKNSNLDSVIEQANQLLLQAHSRLMKEGKQVCEHSLGLPNFNASNLTKLTEEEINGVYSMVLQQTEGQPQCQQLIHQMFVPVLIINKAKTNQDSEQIRLELGKLLKGIM